MNLRQNFKSFAVLAILLFSSSALYAQTDRTATSDTTFAFDKIILDRINVVGSPVWKTSIPGAATYIDGKQLQNQKYQDINRVLRTVSGVNIQEEDGFGLRPNIGIRGAGVERSSKVNLMEDGILIAPAPYAAPAAYYFPMVARMSAVEVRKGSSQIKYGPNTTGGAINLISTPIPFDLSTNAELSIGENSANKMYANIGNSWKNVGFLLEGLQLQNDGFKNLDNGGLTGYNINNFMGKFMVRSSPGAPIYQRMDIKVGYYDEVSDETYLGLTRDDFNQSPFRRYAGSQQDQMTSDHQQYMVRHFAQFSESLDVTSTIYRNNFARNWYKLQSVNGSGIAGVLNNPDQNEAALNYLRGQDSPEDALRVRANNREYFSQGIETIIGFRTETGSVQNSIELGVRLHQDEVDRLQLEDGYKMENGTMVVTNPGTLGEQANRIGEATALSVYLKDEIAFNRLIVTPGIRLENIWFKNSNFGNNDVNRTGSNLSVNEYTITEWIPGVGFSYDLDGPLALIAGVHKGFSPPSPGSDPNTRSEKSINFELGTRFDSEQLQFEVIGFFNTYSNLLGTDLEAGGGGGTNAQFNAGEVNVIGVEVAANTNISRFIETGSVELPLSINYTYTNATFQNSFDSDFGPWGSVEEGDKIPFIPEHQFSSQLGVNYNNVSVNLNASAQPQIRTVAGSGSAPANNRTDAYFLVDAALSYQITPSLNAFTNLRNVFDNTYVVSDRPAGLRPGLPRTLIGGIRVSL